MEVPNSPTEEAIDSQCYALEFSPAIPGPSTSQILAKKRIPHALSGHKFCSFGLVSGKEENFRSSVRALRLFLKVNTWHGVQNECSGMFQSLHLKLQSPKLSFMAQSAASDSRTKKLIQIDVSSDSVCPWCFVGKKNLDQAIASSNDRYDFEIRWHPFFLIPNAPKEGVVKKDFFRNRFGARAEQIKSQMTQIFKGFGLEYDVNGLTGNTLDSHRLIYFAGKQGADKQHKLVEELFLGYFSLGKYIGDRQFLVESAEKVGVEGAAEFLENPNNGLKEVNEELQEYSANISGVPRFVLNGKYQLSGAQPSETFLRTFQAAAS